jgi:hypothetical protein
MSKKKKRGGGEFPDNPSIYNASVINIIIKTFYPLPSSATSPGPS